MTNTFTQKISSLFVRTIMVTRERKSERERERATVGRETGERKREREKERERVGREMGERKRER